MDSSWTPGGLCKITWTLAESTWNMWGKVKSLSFCPSQVTHMCVSQFYEWCHDKHYRA